MSDKTREELIDWQQSAKLRAGVPVSAPTPAAEPADENPYASDIDHLDVALTPAAEEDGFEKWWSARGGHSGASEFRKECAREAYNARPFTFTHYGHETTLDIETAQRLYAENLKQIEALTAELEQRKLFPSQLMVKGGPVVTLAAFDEMKAKLTAERDVWVEKGIRMAAEEKWIPVGERLPEFHEKVNVIGTEKITYAAACECIHA